MKVLGLTGGIGTGKSTASSVITSLGIKIIDLDIVSREVVEDSTVVDILVENFGDTIIDGNGTLLRGNLGKIVFNDEKKLKILNQITHTLIKIKVEEYIKEYSKTEKICVVDGAILIEAGFTDIVDEIILITASRNLQLQRVSQRDGHSIEYIKKVIDSQMSLDEKAKYATYIVENNNGLNELRLKIENIINKLLNLEA